MPASSFDCRVMRGKEMTGDHKPDQSKTAKKRVLVVDDHPLMVHGIIQVINEQPDIEVCGEAISASDALQKASKLKPDITIIDLALGETSGLDLIKDFKIQHPDIAILMLSMHDESLFAERALRKGASGYITKDRLLEDVVAAIRQVMKGEVYLSNALKEKALSRLVGSKSSEGSSPIDTLSDREMQVLEMTGKGLGPSEIAQKLHLSVKTIETHRVHIRKKLDLDDTTALRQYAIHWIQNFGL